VQNLDFAILKMPKIEGKTPCVELSSQPMNAKLGGSKVWSLSVPAPTGWAGETLANSKDRLYSEGVILGDYSESPVLRREAERRFVGESEYKENIKSIIMNLHAMFIATIPMHKGSSGSAIFDEDHKILGITSFVMHEDNGNFDSTYFVAASQIKDYLETTLPDSDPRRIFNCKPTRSVEMSSAGNLRG